MLSPRWKKVIADLWRNKSRTLLVVISIAVGIFAFGGLMIARTVLNENLDENYRARQPADITFSTAAFDDDLARWAARQDHVVAAQQLTAYALQITAGGKTFDLDLLGYDDFGGIQVNRLVPTRGVYPPGRDELVVERDFLQLLGVDLGARVTVRVGEDDYYELTLVGLVSDLTSSGGSVNSQVRGFVDRRTLKRMGLSAEYNRLDVAIERASSPLSSIPAPVVIADDLRERMRFNGINVRSVAIDEDGKSWAVDILNGQTTTFALIGFACLILGSSLVSNIVSGLLAQQTREIAILKILGGTREQIIGIYLVMVLIYGALALVIALPMGISFARGTSNGLGPNLLNFDITAFRVPPELVGLMIAAAFLVPTLAALSPILSGTRITPAQAIRESGGMHQGAFDRALARIDGFSTPTLLTIRNTFRKKGRLISTVLTLALTGALFMSVFNVRAGLQQVIEDAVQLSLFDVQVVLTERLDQRGIERRIKALPGVVTVEGWLTSSVRMLDENRVESENFPLIGLPEDSTFIAPKPEAGQWLSAFGSENRYDIVITRALQDLEPSMVIGGTITLWRGGQEEDWHVVGMIEGGSPVAYGYYHTVSEFIDAPNTTNSIVVRTESADEETHQAVRAEIIDYLDRENHPVASSKTGNTFRRELGLVFDIFAGTLLSVCLLIAFVAGLGLAGTMSLNVLERTREIGVLRSVGARTGIIRRMYITEGVFVGLLSFVVALPLVPPLTIGLGTFLGEIVADQPIAYAVSPAGPPVWLALVLVVALLSSLSPAQRASKISVREALSYE